MDAEIQRLRSLQESGLLSVEEFQRAVQLIGPDRHVATGADAAVEETTTQPENAVAADSPRERKADVDSEPVPTASALRARARKHRWPLAVTGVALAVAIALIAQYTAREDVPTATAASENAARVQISLTDSGIGPFAWDSAQHVVMEWLRDHLGPEEVYVESTPGQCASGSTAFAAWSGGLSFRAIFSDDGLLGYILGPDSSGSRMRAAEWFVGPSDLTIGSSLQDIRDRYPQATLREGRSLPQQPPAVQAIVGEQGFGLNHETREVESMFAGRYWCDDEGIASRPGEDSATPDAGSTSMDAVTPAQPEGITLRVDGLGDVPFGSHPDVAMAWVEERLGPPTNRWENRDIGCPSGMIADAEWDGLALYFFKSWTEEDAGFTGPGFAPSDTFAGYWYEPTSVTPDAPPAGVYTTPEGIGPGATLSAVLEAYPDTTVFDAVKAGEDGSPYGDRPPFFRTSSRLAGELTGTDPESVVLWVSGGSTICGD